MFTNQQWHNNAFCIVSSDQITTNYHHGGTSFTYWDSYLPFLLQNQETLANQLQDLKATIAELQKELAEVTHRVQQQGIDRGPVRRAKGRNGTKGRKAFPKDLKCPFSGCCKKYSSKIALNAHLRKVHRGSSEGDHLEGDFLWFNYGISPRIIKISRASSWAKERQYICIDDFTCGIVAVGEVWLGDAREISEFMPANSGKNENIIKVSCFRYFPRKW